MSNVPRYTHVGRRFRTGYYAVGSEAIRKPGRLHAIHAPGVSPESYAWRALCGEVISRWSDDHFMQDTPQVREASPDDRITCKRCLKALASR